MLNLAFGFVVSFLVIFFIVRSSGLHGSLTMDHDLRGIQKNHAYAVPRIGGVGIACAATVIPLIQPLWATAPGTGQLVLLLCAVPVFAGGVIEDMTKRVSPRVRLLCALASALAACLLMHATLTRVDLPLVDQWLRIVPIGIGFTMLGVAGLTNAVNIIDGFNGLASVVTMLIFASIGYVAHSVNDWLVMSMALTMIGAIGGFVLWNFPVPSVFLGDGGAYFIGFIMAELLVLLIVRNPSVSAWYAMAVAIYPTFETLFSIYRRRIVRGRPAGAPDGLHLHTLVYRRVVRKGIDGGNLRRRAMRNSCTSVYLWVLSLVSIVPATFFWDTPIALAGATIAFVTIYVHIYVAIVRIRTPRWLVITGHAPVVAPRGAEEPRH
ncbi:UDP-N-acetylmuramyl pentapeptide phosphotransferase/UDP-N-acetylglucosamine-1-phosphate transferase [Paraburkholderia sp. BL18I3N2]|uniref:MraY family glycosyltransferase n=1 Tax=Paraburkholderia sp. BL18I3N2 TaxID=1938799 RepID=UPI000D061F23|nr:glycosyltransferase [Paraburkholderia sp. BL18I3N2]PRX36893.1 UDP-N-acetylmuramyl pentapeptide phosphotransferase/UDP-N-acetylglucosamine-1-phosphate transferase [Paraburkholderia sp. BL18I3N2]